MGEIRYIPKWETERAREEKISIKLKPIEMMGFAWEVAKEHLLSFEFETIIKKVETEREKREIDNEMEEIIFIREVANLLSPSWHKEILKNFVSEYCKTHDCGDNDE